MSPLLRFLAPLVGLAAATIVSLASAETRTASDLRFPHLAKRTQPSPRSPLPASLFGRLAAPATIQSLPELCGAWTELFANEPGYWRGGHATVYDSARDRLLVYGGYTAISGQGFSNQVRALSLGASPALTVVETQGADASMGCSYGSAVYDPVRDRLIVFGGYNLNGGMNSGEGPTWTLNLSGTPTWEEMEITGSAPPMRVYHTAIYDVANDRMVIFGGSVAGAGDANDVWALTFSGATGTWTQLSPSGTAPSPRNAHTAVYDGPRNRMVVYGGWSSAAGTGLNDVHALSLAGSGAWSAISPTQGPPTGGYGQKAITDVPRNRMLVFGGWDDNGDPLQDTWSLSFTNPIKWTNESPTGEVPSFYDFFASVYDPVRQRMLSYIGDEFHALGNLGGTPAWTQLTPTGELPRGRSGAAWIHDAPRQRLILFGGGAYPDGSARDLWSYSLTGGTWSRIIPTGARPGRRTNASAIRDPAGDRMILFGGSDDVGTLNDTWQLSLAGTPAWTHLAPSGTAPPARSVHTAILDAPRNRMVVYGGADLGSNWLSDVWALSLSGGTSWSALSPTGGPAPARIFHTSIFDAPRDRMLTFGWNDATVWALGLAGTPSWSSLTTTGTPPPVLAAHVAAYDATRDRMLVGMGEVVGGGGQPTNAMYALELAGTPAWKAMDTSNAPIGRAYTTAVFDAANDRLLMFGGNNFGTSYNDVNALSFPPSFTITTTVSPAAGGQVQQSPSGQCQPAGSQVTLVPYAATGYGFTGWSGDASGAANPLVVTMNAAKNITANFATYALTTQASPAAGGSVSRNPDMASYPPGTQVTLTATPAAGYAFTGWSGDATGSTNPLTITMDAAKNITGYFGGYPVSVTTTPAGTGTVTKNPNLPLYPAGSQVTLTASGGFPFLGWSGDATGTTNPLTLTVDGPKSVTASFQAYSLTTSVFPAGTGSVGRAPNAAHYPPGEAVFLTATPTAGYQFTGWSGDTVGTENPRSLTMTGNKTVTANFALVPAGCGDWSALAFGTSPSARGGARWIWDPVRDRFLVFGGYDGSFLNDVWELTPTGTPTWAQITTSGTPPSGRNVAGVVYDPNLDRMVVIGGNNNSGFLNDVWALSLSGTPTWTSLSPTGTPPVGRYGMTVVYDSQRNRAILFAGFGSNFMNDTWTLTLSGTPAWTPLTVSGTPPGRNQHVAIYDPVRDRMVIQGGSNFSGTLGDTWALTLSGTPAWAEIPAVASSPRFQDAAAVYDPARDRMLVVGGRESSITPDGRYQEVHSLAFEYQPAWRKLPLGGIPMGERFMHVAMYDPEHDLMMVFGGNQALSPSQLRNDTKRMECAGGWWLDGGAENGSWAAYPARGCYQDGAAITVLPTGNANYGFQQWQGDVTGNTQPLDITMSGHTTLLAQFVTGSVGVEDAALAFALREIRPNPNPGPVQVVYSLPRAARVELAVYDLGGRRIARLAHGMVEPGTHTAVWDGRVGGAAANSGIYFVRYETPAGTWTRRVALLR